MRWSVLLILLILLAVIAASDRRPRKVKTVFAPVPIALREEDHVRPLEILEADPEPAWMNTLASWYDHGPPTYCYDRKPSRRNKVPDTDLWTAHKTLPCGTLLEVAGAGGTVEVRVFDRGPYINGRALDLSPRAFEAAVGSLSRGVGPVSYREAS